MENSTAEEAKWFESAVEASVLDDDENETTEEVEISFGDLKDEVCPDEIYKKQSKQLISSRFSLTTSSSTFFTSSLPGRPIPVPTWWKRILSSKNMAKIKIKCNYSSSSFWFAGQSCIFLSTKKILEFEVETVKLSDVCEILHTALTHKKNLLIHTQVSWLWRFLNYPSNCNKCKQRILC